MKPKVGAWRAVGRLTDYPARELFWPEVTWGLVIGVGGTVLLVRSTTLDERMDVMGDVLQLAGALLAVVFTALALVVSIPSTSYVREMAKTRGGMIAFLDPFLVAVGTQAAVLILGFAYKMGAGDVPTAVEHGAFYVAGFLVVFGLLDVVAVARSLVRHGLNRAREALKQDPGEGPGEVRQLDDRRKGG